VFLSIWQTGSYHVKTAPAPRLTIAVSAVALACATLALSGCSDRDTKLSEKVAQADAAAIRAVQAAERAEAAVRQVNPNAVIAAPAAEVATAEGEEEEDPNATEEKAAEEASAPTDSGEPPKAAR
jgi:hypothetical protein